MVWFQDLYSVFSLRSYDSLDPKDRGFLKDYEKFNGQVSSLDRCLQTIVKAKWPNQIKGQVPPNNRKSQMAKSNQRTPSKS